MDNVDTDIKTVVKHLESAMNSTSIWYDLYIRNVPISRYVTYDSGDLYWIEVLYPIQKSRIQHLQEISVKMLKIISEDFWYKISQTKNK